MTQRTGSTGWPIRSHTAVPLVTSNWRRRPSYHRTRTRCQAVCWALSTCSSFGKRAPLTRGRPLVPARRGGAGAYRAASIRSGAINRTPRRAQVLPRARTRYVWSPITVISMVGSQRRITRRIWRAHCGTVLCRRPHRRLTSGVGAGTLSTGSAYDRGVHGGVITRVTTIHRRPLVATERCRLDASGAR
jgi:hypothetical protein